MNFRPSSDTVDSWAYTLRNTDAVLAMKAADFLAQTKDNDYAPAVKHILDSIRELTCSEDDKLLAQETWGTFQTERAQEALRLCGGRSWFGSLPDPNFTGRGVDVAILEKAKAQYRDVFLSLKSKEVKAETAIAIENSGNGALPGPQLAPEIAKIAQNKAF